MPAFYAHLVEGGTKPHAVGKGSKLGRKGKADVGQTGKKHPGAKAQPFLKPAFESTKAEAAGAALAVMGEGISREIARVAAKAARAAKGK